MSIHDRDYMKDSKKDDEVINLNELLVAAGKLIVILIAAAFCLRFPVIWVKIPLLIAVLFFGGRWIFSKPKIRKISKPNSTPKRLTSRKPDDETSVVKQLIAFDAAGEFGKAKALIQSLDGKEFQLSEAEELISIAKNYFPVEVEPTDEGVLFKLAK